MLATLLLGQGTPMLLAGDEIGNSQGGNNNAYAQDNATGWIDWQSPDMALLDFVRKLVALRARPSGAAPAAVPAFAPRARATARPT